MYPNALIQMYYVFFVSVGDVITPDCPKHAQDYVYREGTGAYFSISVYVMTFTAINFDASITASVKGIDCRFFRFLLGLFSVTVQ